MGSRYSYWIDILISFWEIIFNPMIRQILIMKDALLSFCPYQNMPTVICLIREQQKLLKALEKLDAEPRYSMTQSVTTDYCKQWVSEWCLLRLSSNVTGCDRDKRAVKHALYDMCWYCRESSHQLMSPLLYTLPWRSCQTGGMPCRLAWLSCSFFVWETRSCTCHLMI